ncbi:MAG: hypothetical protein K2W95_15780 [Candidatus Obscuribacterales bacterium]|nr:hypothetical protein [Candidatus Obscuribacterales bacterium]
MNKVLLSMLAVLALAMPAQAESFLTIHADGHRESWNQEPQPNQVSPGTVILRWSLVNGDANPNNYVDNGDGTARREPPEVPLTPPAVNVPAFKGAIFADPEIEPAAKVNLLLFFPLIDQYASQPAQMVAAWSAIKAAAFPWLTEGVITKVETYAAANNVTITQ